MAIIKKYVQKQGLSQYQTHITDTGPFSDYFKLAQVPDTLRAGKNGFLINGSANLIRTTDIRMEIIDADGNSVFLQPIKNYQEGLARVVSIEVYDDTPVGPALLTILGEAAYDQSGKPIPPEWRGTYNVKWQKLINIEPFRSNDTPVRVYNKPVLSVEEYLASVTTFQSGALNDINTGSISGPYWTYPASGGWYGAPPAPDSLTTLITATQPIFVANSLYGDLTATVGSTIYSGTIISITSTTKATVSFGIQSSSAGTWYASGYNLVYQDPSVYITSNDSRSYAHLSITNLDTFTGDIQRAKVYMRGTDTKEVYSLLDDIILEAVELTSITSSVGTYDSVGDIYSQGVADAYWEAGILGGIISGTITDVSNYVNASPSVDVTASFNESILHNSVFVNGPSVTNNTVWMGISYDLEMEAGVDYTLESNITCVKPTNESSQLQVRLYNSESLNIGSSDTLGYLITTLELDTAISKEFGTQIIAFTSPITGLARLRFITIGNSANWHFADTKLTVASETGFTPSKISRIIPITNRQYETLQFKVDLLDGAYSVVPITLETNPLFFIGSAVADAPGGGTADSASYANTASYATNAISASYFSGSALFPNGLTVTGSVSASDGFYGFLYGTASYALESLSGGTGSLSSSYALTASYASNAGGSSISSSYSDYAVTASYISGALDITQGLIITGSVISYNGYTGSLLGTASYALNAPNATSASYALTSSYARTAVTASYLSGTINFPTGLIVTGSVSTSIGFSGSGVNITGVISSSYALTSSYAANAINVLSSSYALTSSYAANAINVTSASYALTSSYARTAVTASYLSGTINFPTGLIVTGSVSASAYSGSGANITGVISSSYALTSSYAANAVSVVSSSYALTASYAANAINVTSASYALTSSYARTAVTASYLSGTINFPNGLIVTGSVSTSIGFSGSGANITGVISSSYSLTSSYAANAISVVSSSYALTSSYAANAGGVPVSSSYALTASYARTAVTASYLSGTINFPNGLVVTGSVSASAYSGSGVNITGVISSSYALTSSYAANAVSVVSSSYALTSSYAANAGGVPVSSSYALTASYAKTAATASYLSGTINFPNGLIVTGSVTASVGIQAGMGRIVDAFGSWSLFETTGSGTKAQIFIGNSTDPSLYFYGKPIYFNLAADNTKWWITSSGDFYAGTDNTVDIGAIANYRPRNVYVAGQITTTGITGSLKGSASYALTSSYASNAGGSGVSSSYALTASYAKTAATASYLSGTINFPNGLIVTGSVTASAYTGSGAGIVGVISSSYAVTSSAAGNFYAGGRVDTKTSTARAVALGNVAYSTSLDLIEGQGFTATNTGSLVLTFSSPPAGVFGFVLKLSSGSNTSPARSTAWPSTVHWTSGSSPSLSSYTDVLGFVTLDAGTSWYGSHTVGKTS